MQTVRLLSHRTVLFAADDTVRASNQRFRRDDRQRVPVSKPVSTDAEARFTGADFSVPLHHGYVRIARSADKMADHLRVLVQDRDKKAGLESYDEQRQSRVECLRPANQARWELQQALAIAETNFDLERKIFGKLARAENSSKELSDEEGLDGQPWVELRQEIEEVVATTLSLRL